jgi:hypothetical protein
MLSIITVKQTLAGWQHERSRVPFLVGIGKADVTGPAADVNMMGYALLEQTARGLHTRQHARAYLLADSASQ